MKIKGKILFIPIVVFLFIIIARLKLSYKNFAEFPYYFLGDSSNYLVQVFFLAKYGFHGFVPNFFNGFVLFNNYQPGWPLFVFPIYLLIKNVPIAMYLGVVLTFLLGFIGVYYLGKVQKYSLTKIVAFYVLLFGNPLSIDIIFNVFRFGEFFGWVLFIPFFTIILYYLKRDLDKKFVLFILFYSLIILTHPYVATLSSFVIIPFFFIKKEKITIAVSTLISIVITSFWWIPFLSTFSKPIDGLNQLKELLALSSVFSYNTLILLLFIFLFYLFWKNNRKDKVKFFIPFFVLGVFVLSRLILFIPILNKVPPNSYNIFFLILSLYLFFEIDYSERFKKIIFVSLILVSALSLVIVFSDSKVFLDSDKEVGDDLIKLLEDVENFVILSSRDTNYIVYAVINNDANIIFPRGLIHFEASSEILRANTEIEKGYRGNNCEVIVNNLREHEVENLLSIEDRCDFFESCGLNKVRQEGGACLFSL